MAVLIYLMDGYSYEQQPFWCDMLIEYAQTMIDLHIANFDKGEAKKRIICPWNRTYRQFLIIIIIEAISNGLQTSIHFYYESLKKYFLKFYGFIT